MSKQAKFTGYFKLIDAEPTPVQVVDNVAFDNLTIGNITGWYSNIVTGSGNRIARYTEYELMDSDIEVSRALDIIAEEMTNSDDEGCLQLNVEPDSLDEIEHTTLNAALNRFIKLHKLETALFYIARSMIKYGDAVFTRDSAFAQWNYIQPKHVEGAYVDQSNAQTILGYVINAAGKEATSTPYNFGTKKEDRTVYPHTAVVRFTLNNNMSDSAPFGKSILSTIYKAYQQKKLIEDSVIIYRVQRAPERRVFYIDVGRMPPQRRKAYLEQVKMEMRQRKVPALSTGGENTPDNIYDPQDMMEDYYFATGADSKGSKMEVLNGGQNLGELRDLEYFSSKLFEGLRVPTNWYRAEGNSSVNDGKVGSAYIQELRFSKFVERLQASLKETLDTEFKLFLKATGIRIDNNKFSITMPPPSNFGAYRQASLDMDLLQVMNNVTSIPFISPRFALKRYLQLSENELLENERMLREEKEIPEKDPHMLMRVYQADHASEAGFSSSSTFSSSPSSPPDFDLSTSEQGDLGPDEGEAGAPPSHTSTLGSTEPTAATTDTTES